MAVAEPRTRTPPPAPPQPPAAQTGASIAAATAAPAGTLVAGVVAGYLTAAQIRTVVSATANALRKLSAVRFVAVGALVQRSAAPIVQRSIAPSVERPSYWRRHPLEQLVLDEQDRELLFRRGQLTRVRRDLPKILALPDERRRLERLQGLVGREAHYTRLRLNAIAVRAVGVADSVSVEAASPAGGVWQLGRTRNHTPGCAYLHGRALAWPALRLTRYVPPAHLRCDCRLRSIDSALAERLLVRPVVATFEETLEVIARARALEDT